MADWVSKKLKELGVMRGAGADKLTQPGEKPIRLVNYMDVYTNHRISNATTFQEVTATDREIAECDLKRGDVLFTPSSETPDDIANAAVVAEDLPGAIYSYHLTRFRPHNPESFDTEFLGYLFNNSIVHRYFLARACGLTRFTLNRVDFNNLTIHYPKIELSRRLSEKLGHSGFCDGCSARQYCQGGATAESTQAKPVQWQNIHDGSCPPLELFCGHKRFGQIPKGWRVERLGDVTAKITDGEICTRISGFWIIVFLAEDVFDEGIRLEKAKFVQHSDMLKFRKRCDPEKGDVLVVSRGASVGRTCMVQIDEPFALMDSVILIKPSQTVESVYIAQYLKSFKRGRVKADIWNDSTASDLHSTH